MPRSGAVWAHRPAGCGVQIRPCRVNGREHRRRARRATGQVHYATLPEPALEVGDGSPIVTCLAGDLPAPFGSSSYINGHLYRLALKLTTKLQNFVFTVALAVTFLWNCLWLFAHARTPSAITGLPAFSGVALGILGISHAGYLTGKAIPQSGTPAIDNGNTVLAATKSSPPAPA